MAEKDIKTKARSNGEGTKQEDIDAALATYKAKRDKDAVPHAFNVLFNNEEESKLSETTRINDREVMFFGVNGVRDDALIPLSVRGKSISACLRTRIMRLKISKNGDGRQDVLTVSQLSQEEAAANQGNMIGDVGR
jgi:hypothetical protein